MAATYSSFMTTRYYSPVFNTALFDGPLRIYFSQSYESVALKIYHLLQTQHADVWNTLKNRVQTTKQHVFLMIYPELKDLEMVFDGVPHTIRAQIWEEGLAIGCVQAQTDAEVAAQLKSICDSIRTWNIEGHETDATV